MTSGLGERSRLAVANFAAAATNLCVRAARGPRPYRWLRVAIRGSVGESAPSRGLGGLAAGEHVTLLSLVQLLTAARRDPLLEGVYLEVGPLAASMAAVDAVAEAVERVRRAGKRVVSFLESGGHLEYLLAATADRVHLHPTGTLGLVGLSAEVLLFGEALGRLGVRADLEQVGRYKSAAEAFTRDTLTPPAREALGALIDDLDDQLRTRIAERRRLPREGVDALIDDGPYLAPAALAAGLVDRLSFSDEVVAELVGDDPDGHERDRVVSPRRYARLRHRRRRSAGEGRPVRVAWVPVVGAIRSGGEGPASGGAPSDDVVRRLERARELRGVRAVVVRVDSPGGSGLASDVIWREMVRTRRALPVVLSMGSAAASGGYYVAAPATAIVAAPATLTGSIGVFGGKLVAGELVERFGVRHEAVARGRHARMASTFRPFTPEERARVRADLTAFYDTFVDRVAEGRSLERAHVAEVAEGRVWTGRQALERGLVDALGGILATLDRVRAALELDADHPIELVTIEREHRWARLARWLRAVGLADATARPLLPLLPAPWAEPDTPAGFAALVAHASRIPTPLALMGFELRPR